VAEAARAAGRGVFLVGLEGFAQPAHLAPFPHAMARIGAAGRILDLLRAQGVREVVLIGTVKRPGFFDLRPDAEGAKLLARIGKAAFAGDDGLLRAVVRVLGEMGFTVLGAHEILREALAPLGLLTQTAPDAQAMADIARGVAVARKLGEADVGQGCVVQQGLVLAVEAIEGSAALQPPLPVVGSEAGRIPALTARSVPAPSTTVIPLRADAAPTATCRGIRAGAVSRAIATTRAAAPTTLYG